jgi:hypothetical protein
VPNALLLAFEEGHGDVSCFKVVINAWTVPVKERGPLTDDETGIKFASALEIADALEVYCPYDFIIIDTLDAASKMCTQWETERAGLRHVSDGGDYGKGYDIYQTDPFRRFYNRIVKLGVGVGGTTHVKEEWKKNKYGVEEFRRETSLPAGIQRFVHAQADVIINGELKRRRKGMRDRDRMISFDGTNEVMAGTRVKSVYLPIKYIPASPTIEQPDAPWKQWVSFFENSPAAGQEAEAQYNQLARGKDDENEPDEQAKQETITTNQQPTETAGHTLRGLTRVKSGIPARPTKTESK